MKILILFFAFVSLTLGQNIDSLTYYEKQFNPATYDILNLIFPQQTLSDEGVKAISGFRVQVSTTTNLDSAISLKNMLQNILNSSDFKSQKVYIVYEPPNYKIRVGDFENLQEASRVKNFLVESGFKYAWIVNDKIVKK